MRAAAASLLAGVAATAVGCSGGEPLEWTPVSVADVHVDVPQGWEAQPVDTDGFAAGRWVGPPADDGTRVGISLEVACAEDPGDDAEAILDRYLDGPQWDGHEVIARSADALPDATTTARSVSRYVLPVAATGDDAEITRHAVVAADDGVVALLLVEGVTDRLPTEVAEHVRDSLRFEAATADRIEACGSDPRPSA